MLEPGRLASQLHRDHGSGKARELTRQPSRIKDGNREGASCCNGRQAKEVAQSTPQNDLWRARASVSGAHSVAKLPDYGATYLAKSLVLLRRRRAARDECRVKQVKRRLRRRRARLRRIRWRKGAHTGYSLQQPLAPTASEAVAW